MSENDVAPTAEQPIDHSGMIQIIGDGGIEKNVLFMDRETCQYIGTKKMFALILNLGDYNKFRGWELPKNEDASREGYIVRYEDGYISWSPKEVFESAYRRVNGLNYGLAVEAAKQGHLIARTGWNGKGMFVFIRPADELSVDMIVNKVKSLPQSVKDYYLTQHAWTIAEKENGKAPEDTFVKFTAYFCMKAADGSIVNGWLASQTDMLADDWMIVQ